MDWPMRANIIVLQSTLIGARIGGGGGGGGGGVGVILTLEGS